ncbi:V-type ATP synthase subunit A [Breznakiella homolactica]|uniref:V-type ATP synthase alpha chain n=1 Tax=Breznakiella homolactica TaxID=2798577 RepID=A0A7T7XRM5_9SPIR|nr:V-type ATP synthase subunit A [Breznakiella homolactica]QQO11230.1 V-type ATP synthase subunit A [Breznakiella homolactica]
MINGKVRRISGPIVRAAGLGEAGLFDLVEVGEKRIIGEIVRLEQDEAVIQVYEDDTGMEIGADAVSTGRPLSVRLGPGLIGTIYDGIQRPLELLFNQSGAFLDPGARGAPLDTAKNWHFTADPELSEKLKKGETVTVSGGMILGSVAETDSIRCKIMVPPNTKGGRLTELVPDGDYTCDAVVARTDKGEEIPMAQWWPVRKPRPSAKRLGPDTPLVTGQRVIDVFFPLSKGGTAAIPGGFGTGKTMTQHAVAKWCDADVIIYIGCGERGNEMTDVLTEFPELTDPRTGRSLMERTILIANTSNMPVAAREVSIYTGVTLAEFYRDMGYHVAIMADSTSRWAEALRELSGRMEEMPAEEGFPAYLPTRLAEFYERAGRVETFSASEGSVTIIGAVSPPGGDFSEPVTQHTKRFIRCFWALDRELANARHYPAISWIDSYSEYAEEVKPWWERVSADWAKVRQEAMDLLKKEQRLSEIVRLIGPDALPDDQRLILLTADIIKDGFLQQNSFDDVDMYCAPVKQVRLLELIMEFHERAGNCIKLGAPLIKITSLPIREKLSRLKSVVKNDDLAALSDFEREMKNSLDELERSYRTKEVL